jgi:hypothetical protein
MNARKNTRGVADPTSEAGLLALVVQLDRKQPSLTPSDLAPTTTQVRQE